MSWTRTAWTQRQSATCTKSKTLSLKISDDNCNSTVCGVRTNRTPHIAVSSLSRHGLNRPPVAMQYSTGIPYPVYDLHRAHFVCIDMHVVLGNDIWNNKW